MYTLNIENWLHRSMLEHRRREIANIDFVNKQRAMTLKSVLRQPPWTTHTLPTAVLMWRVVSGRTLRWPGVRSDHCDTEFKLMLFVFVCARRLGVH